MGRTKSTMKLGKNFEKSFFQMKNNILKKKIYELATLCDIKTALIVYGPKKDTPEAHSLEPEIWPQNRDEVIELINKYKGQSPEDRETRTSLLSHFFSDKIKKAQETLTKQRNDNVESKYPTWCPRLDNVEAQETLTTSGKFRSRSGFISRPLIDYNRNRMMVNFDEYAHDMSNIMHNAPISEVYYPTMTWIPEKGYVNNMIWAPPNYYGDGKPLIPPYVMGYRPMAGGSNSYQVVSN